MATFLYTRPVPTAFTLSDGNDYHLHPGHEYELPEENEFIKSLVDQGFLAKAVEPKAPAPNKHKPKNEK